MTSFEAVGMKIETNIPGDVKEFTYAKNCHYLKLRGEDGKETTLVEHGLLKYTCKSCRFTFYAESNQASTCPCCKTGLLELQWMKPQVALVPEKETDFAMKKKEKSDEH